MICIHIFQLSAPFTVIPYTGFTSFCWNNNHLHKNKNHTTPNCAVRYNFTD
nr:MAG TPA: hypothetical protein [Caudoviricetes sp.]